MRIRKNKKIGILSILILCVIIVSAATVGSSSLSVFDSLRIILSKIPVVSDFIPMDGIKATYITIVWKSRVTRILLSGLSGACLAMVGACFQGLFRNPLADPQILGVSSGAAFGATLAMLSGISISILGLGAIGVFAFIGAIITVAFVYVLSGRGNQSSSVYIVLIGTAISSMLSAVISFLMSINRNQLERVYMWTLGSFSSASVDKVRFLALFFVLCSGVLFYYARELNVISIGEETALSLGISTEKVRKRLIFASSLLIAACVSVSGIIGFAGLIVPHCMRLLFGPKYERLLPLCAIYGAIFMIVCDTIARTILAPGELPVGVITSLCGGPYFIFLLIRQKKNSQGF